jgi:predicted membrane-bound spermidine synthase
VKSQPALPAHRPLGPVMLLFLLSGFAGLLYEIVWMKLLTPVVGAALFSVTAVLTVFMGGLALGSLVGGRYLERATSPLRLYGVLEMLVGAYALAVPFIIRAVNPLFMLLYQHHDPALASLDWLRVLVCGIVLLVRPIRFLALARQSRQANPRRSAWSRLGGSASVFQASPQ